VWYDDRLLWVDIGTTTVHRLDPATGKQESTRVDRAVGALAPDLLGTVVTATDAGLARLSNGTLESLAEVEAEDPGTRMNDGKVGPAGRFLAGTIALNLAEGAGSMYSLQPDHSVRTVLSGLTVSNGLGWSPNGKSLYSIESFNFGVDPYDYDVADGTVGARQRAVDIPEPSEWELSQRFQVSRMTARKAVNRLVAEGLLVRRPGNGTLVARRRMPHGASQQLSFQRPCDSFGLPLPPRSSRCRKYGFPVTSLTRWGSKLVFPLSWSAVFAAWRTNQPPSIRRMDGDHFSYLLQADLTGLFTDIMAGGGDRVV
jgi:SMP-30/Gluconolactonase/LRE-like region/Bacterial regulatory proteins, gntR family